jgi:hypothetical protein
VRSLRLAMDPKEIQCIVQAHSQPHRNAWECLRPWSRRSGASGEPKESEGTGHCHSCWRAWSSAVYKLRMDPSDSSPMLDRRKVVPLMGP